VREIPSFNGQRGQIGTYGEQLAAKYLRENGYKIVRTNVSFPYGEIDIIARDRDKTLVFVEVKAMARYGHIGGLRPEDNLTRAKLVKLKKSSQFFANQNQALSKNGWRIDLIALTILEKSCDIRHLKNIG